MPDYRRILALVEFTGAGTRAARRAADLARRGNAELALLHWIRPDRSFDGGYPCPTPDEEKLAYETAALHRLAALAGDLGADGARLITAYGPSGRTLAAAVASWQPDLIVCAGDPSPLTGRHDLLSLGRSDNGLTRLLGRLAAYLGGGLASPTIARNHGGTT